MNPDYEAMQNVVLENEAALKAADLERVMATFAPDPTFDVYPFGLHIAGDEAAREMFAGMLASGMASFDSRQIGLWVNDEGVIRELVAVLQGLDEFFGFEIPEGATAEMHTVNVFLFEGGKIKAERTYFDRSQLLEQFGYSASFQLRRS
jgi:hypothetical protein